MLKVLVFNILIIVGFFSTFHTVYYNRMKAKIYPELGQAVYPYLNSDLMKRLGHFVVVKKESSFLNFPMKKTDPYKVRIGIFGDSYVYGDEVGPAGDYPSQLQKILGDEYEVLNFGMSWFSINQSFILWQEFHQKFELDLVIFGPRSQFRYRNLTFNHSADTHPHYLHSRFIITVQQTLQELTPIGENHEERVHHYYSLFPSLQYWRYDERAPSLFRSFGHYFKTNLRNPFYYYQDSYTENRLINRALIKKMSEESRDFLFISEPEYLEIVDLKDFLSSDDNIQSMLLGSNLFYGFPFRATDGHATVFGNALVAEAVAQKILGKTRPFSLPTFKVDHPLVPVNLDSLKNELKAMPKLREIRAELNHSPIAYLDIFPSFSKTVDPEEGPSLDQFEVLLGFACENLPLSRSAYIGLKDHELEDFLKVIESKNLPLVHGESFKNLLYLPMKDCLFSDRNHTISFARNEFHQLLVEELKLLEIYDTGKSNDEYYLYRPKESWVYLRVAPDLDPSLLKTSASAQNIISFSSKAKKI